MTSDQFWIYVVSVLISPLLAVQASVWIQRSREKRDRRLSVFKSLMRTRGSLLAPDHVQALNRIDVEFYGRDQKSQAVLRAWKAYLDHLNSADSATPEWGVRREDFFIDLLFAMGKCLGYDFDKTDIRRTSYFPRGHGEVEADLNRIRKGLAEIAEGKRPLPVTTYAPPSAGERSGEGG